MCRGVGGTGHKGWGDRGEVNLFSPSHSLQPGLCWDCTALWGESPWSGLSLCEVAARKLQWFHWQVLKARAADPKIGTLFFRRACVYVSAPVVKE